MEGCGGGSVGVFPSVSVVLALLKDAGVSLSKAMESETKHLAEE
jgi:hypothetical protein